MAVARALEAIDSIAPHCAAAVVTEDGAVAVRGDDQAVFALASVSKLLTSYATLVALEEGSVSLDDPVGPPGSTLAHLLSHASGLSPLDPGRVLAPPGKRRIYSNAGMDLVGRHVETSTGMPFATYVDEAVCAPLAMGDTDVTGTPSAGARSSVRDLARFAAELLSPRLIDGTTLSRATTVVFPGLAGVLPGFGHQDPCDFGLGFELKDGKSPHWTGSGNSPSTFGHFGQSGTFVWVDPVVRAGLVFLADRPFDEWARLAWPALSDGVVDALASS